MEVDPGNGLLRAFLLLEDAYGTKVPNKLPPELFLESEPAEEAEQRFHHQGWRFRRVLMDLGLQLRDTVVDGSTISQVNSQHGGNETQTRVDGPYSIDNLRRKGIVVNFDHIFQS